PGNTTTFDVDVTYRDGSPVTGLNSSNITALAIRNGASQSILPYLNNFTEQSPGTYLLNMTLPSSMVGGDVHLDLTVSTGTYSGTYTEDISVHATYLTTPYWTSGYNPSDINIYTFGTGYDTYNISIKNNGLEPSGTMTATLTTCGASYLAIVDDAAQTISSIPAGSTGYARWRVDPIANNTGCTVTVTVTGGKFWFSETSASLSKTIDITNPQAVVPVEEEETDEVAPSLLSTCDVSTCDYDEKCVNGVCTHFDCDNGYYSNHECIKYVYSINFTSVPQDVEIVQGNSSSIKIYYKNTGNMEIEDFSFTLDGLDNTSSYKVVTNLPDKILDDEPQDVVMLINLSSDAPVGRHTITVWFRSDKLTTSKTFILSILPDAESIAEIDEWMPELEKDIDNLKKSFDKIKDSINGTNYTFLNNTIHSIDILYAEAKNATLSGDFLTAYEKKAQIENLIAQANALISDQPLKKQGGTLKYMFLALLFIILPLGTYLLYDQSRTNGYHIFKGLSISHLKQMRLIPFLSSAGRQTSPNNTQRHISAGKVNISSYHHLPTFEVRLLRAMHSLRHRINLKLESMHSRQTKLDSNRFVKSPGSYIPRPPVRTVAPSYAPVRNNTAIRPHTTQPHNPAHTPKHAVRPVSKMMKHFERSKTRCGICGKDFRNVHELELHRKYSHRSLHRK
ncbi:MAG: hypothetical protein KAI51_01765, partial [Candidatus Aenigmarchaeota archaeon]|nr:hypothetical protein [Candidatus Aenigmarchaeota archaeon]